MTQIPRYKRATQWDFLPNPFRRKMDRGIQSLVDAMNGTGLFVTLSSCAGHFPPPKRDPYKGLYAFIIFQLKPIQAEHQVEDLAAFLHGEAKQTHSGRRDRFWFELIKHYSVEKRPGRSLEFHSRYSLKIHPRSLCCSEKMKRMDVNRGIEFLTREIEEFGLIYKSRRRRVRVARTERLRRSDNRKPKEANSGDRG